MTTIEIKKLQYKPGQLHLKSYLFLGTQASAIICGIVNQTERNTLLQKIYQNAYWIVGAAVSTLYCKNLYNRWCHVCETQKLNNDYVNSAKQFLKAYEELKTLGQLPQVKSSQKVHDHSDTKISLEKILGKYNTISPDLEDKLELLEKLQSSLKARTDAVEKITVRRDGAIEKLKSEVDKSVKAYRDQYDYIFKRAQDIKKYIDNNQRDVFDKYPQLAIQYNKLSQLESNKVSSVLKVNNDTDNNQSDVFDTHKLDTQLWQIRSDIREHILSPYLAKQQSLAEESERCKSLLDISLPVFAKAYAKSLDCDENKSKQYITSLQLGMMNTKASTQAMMMPRWIMMNTKASIKSYKSLIDQKCKDILLKYQQVLIMITKASKIKAYKNLIDQKCKDTQALLDDTKKLDQIVEELNKQMAKYAIITKFYDGLDLSNLRSVQIYCNTQKKLHHDEVEIHNEVEIIQSIIPVVQDLHDPRSIEELSREIDCLKKSNITLEKQKEVLDNLTCVVHPSSTEIPLEASGQLQKYITESLQNCEDKATQDLVNTLKYYIDYYKNRPIIEAQAALIGDIIPLYEFIGAPIIVDEQRNSIDDKSASVNDEKNLISQCYDEEYEKLDQGSTALSRVINAFINAISTVVQYPLQSCAHSITIYSKASDEAKKHLNKYGFEMTHVYRTGSDTNIKYYLRIQDSVASFIVEPQDFLNAFEGDATNATLYSVDKSGIRKTDCVLELNKQLCGADNSPKYSFKEGKTEFYHRNKEWFFKGVHSAKESHTDNDEIKITSITKSGTIEGTNNNIPVDIYKVNNENHLYVSAPRGDLLYHKGKEEYLTKTDKDIQEDKKRKELITQEKNISGQQKKMHKLSEDERNNLQQNVIQPNKEGGLQWLFDKILGVISSIGKYIYHSSLYDNSTLTTFDQETITFAINNPQNEIELGDIIGNTNLVPVQTLSN